MLKLIFSLLFSISIFGQNITNSAVNDINHKRNVIYSTNFYGPVKTVRWYYTYVADSLKMNKNRKNLQENIMYINRDIAGMLFYEFDKEGKIIKTVSRYSKFDDLRKYPLQEKYASYYNYDSIDIKNKSEINIQNNYPYPTANYYQSVKLDRKVVANIYDADTFVNTYRYIVDRVKKRILEEKHYSSINTTKDLTSKKNLETSIKYEYNTKGELTRQLIKPGEAGKNRPFFALGTESEFCQDLNLSYKYDEKS